MEKVRQEMEWLKSFLRAPSSPRIRDGVCVCVREREVIIRYWAITTNVSLAWRDILGKGTGCLAMREY